MRNLKDRGPKIYDNDKDNFTPLLRAVWKGQDHVIEYLLDNGANIELTDSKSRSVMHLAVESGRNKTLKLLIQKGGERLVNRTDKNCKTPLHYAASSGNGEVMFTYFVCVIVFDLYSYFNIWKFFVWYSFPREKH